MEGAPVISFKTIFLLNFSSNFLKLFVVILSSLGIQQQKQKRAIFLYPNIIDIILTNQGTALRIKKKKNCFQTSELPLIVEI